MRRGVSGRALPGIYLAVCVGAGALAGLVWRATTPLPDWTVQDDGTVVLGEHVLTSLFEATARYTVVAAVGGLLLGLLALALLRRRGWPVVAWSVVGPVLAGLAAWTAGVLGGPSAEELLAGAGPGSSVPVDLALRAPVAVLVWPFLAMLPVLLWSAFSPDPDQKQARSTRSIAS